MIYATYGELCVTSVGTVSAIEVTWSPIMVCGVDVEMCAWSAVVSLGVSGFVGSSVG